MDQFLNNAQSNLTEQYAYESIPLGLPWRILIFSIALFGLALFSYAGLRFGYMSYVNSQLSKIDNDIEVLADQVSQEDQNNFIAFYSQLLNLKKVLEEHKYSGNMFTFLEENTLPTVVFSAADVKVDGYEVTLKGDADNFQSLLEQLSVFDGAKELSKKPVIDTLSFNGGSVGFSMIFNFKQDAFARP